MGCEGSLCMRRPRLSRGLPLREVRWGACACGGDESGGVGDMGRAGLGMRGEPARWAAAVGGGSPAVQKRPQTPIIPQFMSILCRRGSTLAPTLRARV